MQGKEAQEAVDFSGKGAFGKGPKLPDHFQILEAGEMGVDVRLLGNVAEALPVRDSITLDRFALEKDLASTRLDETRNHLQGSGLAGAVGSQISSDFTAARYEADVFHRGNSRVELRDVSEFERHLLTAGEQRQAGKSCSGILKKFDLHGVRRILLVHRLSGPGAG